MTYEKLLSEISAIINEIFNVIEKFLKAITIEQFGPENKKTAWDKIAGE